MSDAEERCSDPGKTIETSGVDSGEEEIADGLPGQQKTEIIELLHCIRLNIGAGLSDSGDWITGICIGEVDAQLLQGGTLVGGRQVLNPPFNLAEALINFIHLCRLPGIQLPQGISEQHHLPHCQQDQQPETDPGEQAKVTAALCGRLFHSSG